VTAWLWYLFVTSCLRGSTTWRLPPSSLLTQSSTDASETDCVVELEPGGRRSRAVIGSNDGMSVTDLERRNEVRSPDVADMLRHFDQGGMAAQADKSSKPESCPHLQWSDNEH
jgi:hypothetical protein